LLPARLVHHTGTMIRFTTAQLDRLPNADRDCTIVLPDGAVLNGHFRCHPANPYIGGPSLVRWIKSWVPYNVPTAVTVHQVGVANTIRLQIGAIHLAPADAARRRRVLARARQLKQQEAERRRRSYETWERDPNLRRIALLAWGSHCQVVGCTFLLGVPAHIREKMVDVHHLNHVGKGGSDSPMNICVLCVVHHQMIHRAPTSNVHSWDLDQATVNVNGLTLSIHRDARRIL